jgi:hypothetical protein
VSRLSTAVTFIMIPRKKAGIGRLGDFFKYASPNPPIPALLFICQSGWD